MTIDEYAEERNNIFFSAQALGKHFDDVIWTELGVANRHISRVLNDAVPMRMVEGEIESCFRRVRKMIEDKKLVSQAISSTGTKP